jgi:hypothetical protein
MAKKHLLGLKENALRALSDQGVLAKPIDIVLTENVMPWILERMMEFMVEDDDIEVNAEDILVNAFDGGKQ